ncbi:MAG: pilus assembly protein TadG-related protein [Planctomycetaceae bacterium]|nr:pilus assembly protein TadG-related protein [Planctomycetaceae bacterium]
MRLVLTSVRSRAQTRARQARSPDDRRGSVLVLSAAVLVIIFAMVAFSVDMGYVALTKTQLQIASDGAALGACLELPDGLGPQPVNTLAETESLATSAALSVAGDNKNGDQAGTYLNAASDVTFGQAVWNPDTKRWTTTWDVFPYNAIRITSRRDASGSLGGDRPLDLMFAPVLGIDNLSINTEATAALLPGVGFQIGEDSSDTIEVLPIALDVPTWTALLNGVGSDNYHYDSGTGAVTAGSDGILEVDLYPYGNGALPPGNRGTVDLGSPNNSTVDLKRQILYGLNAYDLSFFDGVLRTDEGDLTLNGDTGISAGIKAELETIKGRPRLMPLFSAVSGPGNNAMYTVPKFVGIRIMHVKLTGGSKQVIIQPAPFVSKSVVRGGTTIGPDTYYTPPRLIN